MSVGHAHLDPAPRRRRGRRSEARADGGAASDAPRWNWCACSPRDSYGRVGLGILVFFVVLAAIAPAVIPMDPWANNYRADGSLARLDGPSWRHLLGTTYYGQDVLSQLILGTRQTILVGFVTAILIGFIGTNVGLVSGYFGGVVDDVLMRITDFFYAIPFLPFMMVVVALIDRSLPVIIASMALHLLAHRRARRPRAGADAQDAALCACRARERGGPPAHHVCAYPAERAAPRLPLPHLRRGLGDPDRSRA